MSVSFSYFKFQSLMLDKGTTTSIVTKYSLSNTKCSFFTKSATFLEERIRLKNSSFQSYVFLKIPNRQQETMFKENIVKLRLGSGTQAQSGSVTQAPTQ